MPHIEARRNGKGDITSFKIVVSAGYDCTGTQIRHRSIWTPPRHGMTERQMQKEATAYAFKFEEQINNGYILDNNQPFFQYAQYVLQVKETEGVRPSTLDRYIELLVRINQKIGHLEIGKIRPQHLNAFYTDLKENGYRLDSERAVAKRALKITMSEMELPKTRLAKMAGVAASTITNATRGDPIKVEVAMKIAKALDAEFDEMFKLNENKVLLSDKTILEHHRLISTILAQAEKEMLIMYNPAAKASPPRPKAGKPDYYQPDEIEEIINALETAPLKWKAITYLLMDTGARRGEILGLKPENVNYEEGFIIIDHALLYTKSKGVYEGETKNGKARAVMLAPQSLKLLRQWKIEQQKMKLVQGDRWIDSGYIFTQDDGDRLHPDSITDWLSNFSEKNNLPHIHPHAFRHTAASMMIANGVDLVTTANELGHANATTTAMIYAHQISIAKINAANVRAGVFAPKSAKPKKKRA